MSNSDKPQPPADNECCESGCEPCVWDTYREELAEWQAAQPPRQTTADKPQCSETQD